MQRSDLLLGLYILVPVIFLIIPIPTLLLDFLIADVSVSDDSADDNAVSSVPERWIYP